VGDDGQIVDFPSDAGQVTLNGSAPSLDVRGANTYMTLSSTAPANGLNVSEDEQGGSISATSNNVALTVGRGNQVAASNGAGGLTYGSDGTISTTNDSADTTVQVEFLHNGELVTTTLYSGSAVPGSGLTFTAAQIAAAEAAASAGTNTTTTTTTTTNPPAPPSVGSARVGSVKVGGSAVNEEVSCTGASSATCELTLTLTVTETLKGGKVVGVSASKRKKKRPKTVKRTVTVGSATVTLTGGQSKVVKVTLNAAGKRLLSSRHKLTAQLTTTQTTGGHSTVLSRRTVMFKAPRKAKHRKKR